MRTKLFLVGEENTSKSTSSFDEKLADHNAIIDGYLDTLLARNLSPGTIDRLSKYLPGWFAGIMVPDENHPDGERQLLVWEAMAPGSGYKYIIAFSKGLICYGLNPRTVNQYVGYLRRFFQYVLDVPYIPGNVTQCISVKYGRIEQPVLEYYYPSHVIDNEPEGFTLTAEELVEFYDFIRLVHIPRSQKKNAAARDYSMIVLAAETGLRADELRNLDVIGQHVDLSYERGRVQTRSGKGTKGSGKRIRKTLFTPFAQATIRHYVESFRPEFINAQSETALFLSEAGSRISYNAMYRNLKNITESARKEGLAMPPKLNWHDLRRTFATLFIERYPDRTGVLMDMLGHINPSTLNRYIRHRRAFYERALDSVLDDLQSKVRRT